MPHIPDFSAMSIQELVNFFMANRLEHPLPDDGYDFTLHNAAGHAAIWAEYRQAQMDENESLAATYLRGIQACPFFSR